MNKGADRGYGGSWSLIKIIKLIKSKISKNKTMVNLPFTCI